jgi:tetratricopeptide (TPR) repeat protein
MYFLLVDAIREAQKEQERAIALQNDVCNALISRKNVVPLPPALNFRLDAALLPQDFIGIINVQGGFLCSQSFLEILGDAVDSYAAYPAQLIDERTGEALPLIQAYFFWAARPIAGAIDWERSAYWIDDQSEMGGQYLTTLRLVSDLEEATSPLLFRAEPTFFTFVHALLRKRIEASSLVGIAFAPLDAMYSPSIGVQRLAFEQIAQERPNDAQVWYEIGKCQALLHHLQESLDATNRALSLQSDMQAAQSLRGSILYELGHLEEASEAWHEVIEKDMHNALWLHYSKVLRNQGRYEESLTLIEQHRGQGWDQGRPFWCELGAALAALGRDEEALRAFDKATGVRGSRREEAYEGKGNILCRLGRYEEALAVYTEGLKGPQPTRALWRGKARVLRQLGRNEEAKEAEQKLRELEQMRTSRMQIKQ